jgi:hypothetical protein
MTSNPHVKIGFAAPQGRSVLKDLEFEVFYGNFIPANYHRRLHNVTKFLV